MIQAECIQKLIKNNKIYGYRLKDQQGNITEISVDNLKNAIRNGQITVLNLILTSNNRLITNTRYQKWKQEKLYRQKANHYIAKAKLLGFKIKAISTSCNILCYLISESEVNHTLYIPDGVTNITINGGYNIFDQYFVELNGTIKVIGGTSLKDTSRMFESCEIEKLDLSLFNTSNVTKMARMFEYAKIQSINFSSFDTSKVTDMRFMFNGCNIPLLDLSSFSTYRVDTMASMFSNSKIKELDLSSFSISNRTNIQRMFTRCQAQVKVTDPRIKAEQQCMTMV